MVTREGLAEDGNQGPVAGKENAVQTVGHIVMFGGSVKSDQCFSRAWNAGNKTNGFARSDFRVFEDFGYYVRCNPDICLVGLMPGYIIDRIAAIQGQCRLNNCRC